MHKRFLVLFLASSIAHPQSPQELLRRAQETYTDAGGVEVKGTGNVRPHGSSWQMNFDVTLVARPAEHAAPGQAQKPAQLGLMVGSFRPINVGNDKLEKIPAITVPFAVAGSLDRIAEDVVSVHEIGTETLPLNGSPSDCHLLDVEYKTSGENPPNSNRVTYSICSEKHLVLKKLISYPTDVRSTGPPALWTFSFDSALFSHPVPKWLTDAENAPSLITRREWIGRLAPHFTLTDLKGSKIESSSMSGKVVVLDFWSTSCPPCLRALPMIETIRRMFEKNDVALWGVSFDKPEQSKKWLAQHQQSMSTLSDTDFVVSDLYQVQGIPAVIVVGRDGRIKNYWTGEVPQEELQSAIQRALED